MRVADILTEPILGFEMLQYERLVPISCQPPNQFA